jgi:hypothetical protein
MRLYKIRLTLSSSQFVYVNATWDYTKFGWLYWVLDLFMWMLHEIIQSLVDSINFSICSCKCYMRLYKIWLTLLSSRFVYVNVIRDYTKFGWLYWVLDLFMWMLHEIIQSLIDSIKFSICLCECYMRLHKIRLTLSSSRFVYVNVTCDYTKFDWLYQVLDLFMWTLHAIIQNLIDFVEFSICSCKCYMRLYKIWLTLSSSQFVCVNVIRDYTKFGWLYRVLDLLM